MFNMYFDCQTYLDVGTARFQSDEIKFKTMFVRPSLFRFEWAREAISGIIYSNQAGSVVIRTSDLPEVAFIPPDPKSYTELRFALGSIAGGSLGSSQMIPPLLSTLNVGPGILQHPVVGSSTDDHYVKYWTNDLEFWIDDQSSIRKIKCNKQMPTLSSLEFEITYEIVRFNDEISSELFDVPN